MVVNAPVAAMMRARRRLLSHLEKAGAVSAETATAFEPRRRMDRKALAYMRDRGIVFEPQPGRYFARPEAAEQWRRSVRRRLGIAFGAALATAAAAFAISR
jgi:hypothetical protein